MIELAAYAKLNLTLDVAGKRPDGYHDLVTIMHAVDIFDSVFIEKSDGVHLSCTEPLPEDGVAVRAARAYCELTGHGADIHIERRIPNQSGMGAASANAAAVLRGMERLYGAAGEERLHDIAASISADAPFCLMGGCALAEGIGDRLTPLDRLPMDILIVKGECGISTKELFSSLRLPVRHPDTESALTALQAGDPAAFAPHIFNALEDAATDFCPEIAEYRARLIALGALGADMTGSGSAVFGVFSDAEAAERARAGFSDCRFTAVCRTV